MTKKSKKQERPVKPAFTALVKDGTDTINFSWGSARADDGQGNEVVVFIWVTGDWKVKYKGKEYIIPMSENVNALIEWIERGES